MQPNILFASFTYHRLSYAHTTFLTIISNVHAP
jgi:hypothetical protein